MGNQIIHRSAIPKTAFARVVYGLISCLLLGMGALHAQNNEPALFEEAEKLFNEKNYYEAAQYYEKFLAGGKDSRRISASPFAVRKKGEKTMESKVARQGAVYRLAESYRLHNDFKQAEKWYKEASSFSLSSYPASQYWYGVALRTNQKYDEALKVISEFRDSRNAKDEWMEAADRELANLRYIRAQTENKKQSTFTVKRKPNAANTSAYAIATSAAKESFFTAMFVDSSKMYRGYPAYSARLYSAPDSGNIRETAKLVNIPEEPGYNNGLPSLTRDGQQLFFTRWKKEEGVISSAIYTSKKNTDGSWSAPEKLQAPVNLEGSNSTQPSITPDGKYLLFSSDRKGGFGKYDIWFAKLNASLQPVSAHNMGIFINTPNDEATPWYHPASNSLVFSSNGHVGMGGFDIYASKGSIESITWEHPVNPGAPVNSSKDDQYYIGTDEDNLWNTGWLSSDRETDCCLDLFEVKSDNVQFISGRVVDEKTGVPIPHVAVLITDPKKEDNVMLVRETDSLGFYQFELRNTSRYNIIAQKPTYKTDTSSYVVAMLTGRDSITNKDLLLTTDEIFDPDVGEPPDPADEIFKPDKGKDPPERPPGERSDPVLIARFDFDRSFLKKQYYQNLDTLIMIMERNPSMIVELSGHTDAFGTEDYNFRLAQQRVDACINYLRDRGIGTDRLIGRSYGESSPVVSEIVDGLDNPEGRALNRRVEFRILQGASANTGGPSVTRDAREITERQSGSVKAPVAAISKSGRVGRNQRKSDGGAFQPVVHFAFDKSLVDDEYFNNLDRLAELMNQDPSMKVEVNGYTDAKGSAAYNLGLAQERVDAVIIYLEQQGISRTRLSGRAFGECCPLAAETINGRDNPEGRFMNRRVEFKFIR
jgi:OmpA-OmpF porin, OOP family